jgi:hypothetical protein
MHEIKMEQQFQTMKFFRLPLLPALVMVAALNGFCADKQLDVTLKPNGGFVMVLN